MNILEKNITRTETFFNILGSIPVVSIVSGMVRSIVCKIYFVAGMIFTAFSLLFMAYFSRTEAFDRWAHLAEKGALHMFHALANVFRGYTESSLGCTTIGSFILLAVQLVSEEGFAPRLTYS